MNRLLIFLTGLCLFGRADFLGCSPPGEVNFSQVGLKSHPEEVHSSLELGRQESSPDKWSKSDQALASSVMQPEEAEIDTSYSMIDCMMAAMLGNELIEEEPMSVLPPQLEDLSHLAKRPTVILAEPPLIEVECAYEALPITTIEKQKIGSILVTMAENNIFKLLFERKYLEKLGREINHVHPIRFLGTVFSDSRLVNCMHEIRRSGFKWDGFIEGFSRRFLEEAQVGNVNAYIPGFAKSLGLKQEDVLAYVNHKDFEGLVLYLMEKSRLK